MFLPRPHLFELRCDRETSLSEGGTIPTYTHTDTEVNAKDPAEASSDSSIVIIAILAVLTPFDPPTVTSPRQARLFRR